MIGQSFAPLGDPTQQRPSAGGANTAGPQEAIRVLNLRMPRVFGAGAPAPAQLLTSPGSAGLPQQNAHNPLIEAILRAVMGGFGGGPQVAPSAPGGMPPGGMSQGMPGGGAPAPSPTIPAPAVHYQPNPPGRGGTAGPNPPLPREDRPTPGRRQGPDNYPGR